MQKIVSFCSDHVEFPMKSIVSIMAIGITKDINKNKLATNFGMHFYVSIFPCIYIIRTDNMKNNYVEMYGKTKQKTVLVQVIVLQLDVIIC